MNNVQTVWGEAPVKSVNSLQDLAKLVQSQEVQEVKEEAKPTPKEYAVRGAAWGTQRAKVQAALVYSKKHPEVKASEVARQFGIKLQTLYSAKYKAKLKVHSKLAKAREAKAAKATDVTPTKEWTHAAVSTSVVSVKQDMVNHPAHYKAGGIETIDFIEAKNLNYNLGNVVKYVTRARLKGSLLQDLEKAAWYLNREIETLKK